MTFISSFLKGETIDSITLLRKDTSYRILVHQLYITSKFNHLSNYHSSTNFNFDLSTKYNYSKKSIRNNLKAKIELSAQLDLTKYIDSVTTIGNDQLEFIGNYESKINSIINTLNVNITSQFANSYQYKFQNNAFVKFLATQPFLPIVVGIGVGFNLNCTKNNYINLSIADIKTTFISERMSHYIPGSATLTNDLNYIPELGISISSLFTGSWLKETLTWRNNSRVFAKGLTKKDFQLTMKNRLMYEIAKWVNLNYETQILYDPEYNYKFQFKNEISIGLLFKNRSKQN